MLVDPIIDPVLLYMLLSVVYTTYRIIRIGILYIFRQNGEEKEWVDNMKIQLKEYDFHVGPRGGMTKTRKKNALL